MNLEEIITAAVEKRVSELVATAIEGREVDYHRNSVEQALESLVRDIANDEVQKHEAPIRAAIQNALAEAPTTFEITAYTNIKPRKK